MAAPASFNEYVKNNAEAFIDRLRTAVAHKSVSGDSTLRQNLIDTGIWLKGVLENLGVTVKLHDLGKQEGTDLQLPYLVLGSIGTDTDKKTVLVYGHYDVMPATVWQGSGDPFTLDVEGNVMYGRGSTDDKGPVMGWLNVLEAHQNLGLPLPVNIRFLFEGMEEVGSPGLDDFIIKEVQQGDFFTGVDCVCITDNYWLTTRRPVLTYGVRGIAYFTMDITGAKDDLHSGLYGRMIHEPMTDMVKLLSKLVETTGVITVPGVEDQVPPPTDQEREQYRLIDYQLSDLWKDTGGRQVELSEVPADLLMGRMRFPSLSIHGIRGTFDTDDGLKTIIPANISARFSLRLVEPLTPDNVIPLVTEFLQAEFAKLNSKNQMRVNYEGGGLPWVGDRNHWNYQAADAATKAVWGNNLYPNYVREGGSIPVTLTFSEQLGKNVLLLPMGQSDDGAHSSLEKLDVSNYINGTTVFGEYLYQVANAQT
ncbi:CNDP dipeptidase [Pisolithus marmoratus]|nr:CNDP dipeptidase [Pisolithus marmoratus]